MAPVDRDGAPPAGRRADDAAGHRLLPGLPAAYGGGPPSGHL
ncbi:hypothetical protein ABZ439_18995 [Streptomyces sp. NPDC005840]